MTWQPTSVCDDGLDRAITAQKVEPVLWWLDTWHDFGGDRRGDGEKAKETKEAELSGDDDGSIGWVSKAALSDLIKYGPHGDRGNLRVDSGLVGPHDPAPDDVAGEAMQKLFEPLGIDPQKSDQFFRPPADDRTQPDPVPPATWPAGWIQPYSWSGKAIPYEPRLFRRLYGIQPVSFQWILHQHALWNKQTKADRWPNPWIQVTGCKDSTDKTKAIGFKSTRTGLALGDADKRWFPPFADNPDSLGQGQEVVHDAADMLQQEATNHCGFLQIYWRDSRPIGALSSNAGWWRRPEDTNAIRAPPGLEKFDVGLAADFRNPETRKPYVTADMWGPDGRPVIAEFLLKYMFPQIKIEDDPGAGIIFDGTAGCFQDIFSSVGQISSIICPAVVGDSACSTTSNILSEKGASKFKCAFPVDMVYPPPAAASSGGATKGGAWTDTLAIAAPPQGVATPQSAQRRYNAVPRPAAAEQAATVGTLDISHLISNFSSKNFAGFTTDFYYTKNHADAYNEDTWKQFSFCIDVKYTPPSASAAAPPAEEVLVSFQAPFKQIELPNEGPSLQYLFNMIVAARKAIKNTNGMEPPSPPQLSPPLQPSATRPAPSPAADAANYDAMIAAVKLIRPTTTSLIKGRQKKSKKAEDYEDPKDNNSVLNLSPFPEMLFQALKNKNISWEIGLQLFERICFDIKRCGDWDQIESLSRVRQSNPEFGPLFLSTKDLLCAAAAKNKNKSGAYHFEAAAKGNIFKDLTKAQKKAAKKEEGHVAVWGWEIKAFRGQVAPDAVDVFHLLKIRRIVSIIEKPLQLLFHAPGAPPPFIVGVREYMEALKQLFLTRFQRFIGPAPPTPPPLSATETPAKYLFALNLHDVCSFLQDITNKLSLPQLAFSFNDDDADNLLRACKIFRDGNGFEDTLRDAATADERISVCKNFYTTALPTLPVDGAGDDREWLEAVADQDLTNDLDTLTTRLGPWLNEIESALISIGIPPVEVNTFTKDLTPFLSVPLHFPGFSHTAADGDAVADVAQKWKTATTALPSAESIDEMPVPIQYKATWEGELKDGWEQIQKEMTAVQAIVDRAPGLLIGEMPAVQPITIADFIFQLKQFVDKLMAPAGPLNIYYAALDSIIQTKPSVAHAEFLQKYTLLRKRGKQAFGLFGERLPPPLPPLPTRTRALEAAAPGALAIGRKLYNDIKKWYDDALLDAHNSLGEMRRPDAAAAPADSAASAAAAPADSAASAGMTFGGSGMPDDDATDDDDELMDGDPPRDDASDEEVEYYKVAADNYFSSVIADVMGSLNLSEFSYKYFKNGQKLTAPVAGQLVEGFLRAKFAFCKRMLRPPGSPKFIFGPEFHYQNRIIKLLNEYTNTGIIGIFKSLFEYDKVEQRLDKLFERSQSITYENLIWTVIEMPSSDDTSATTAAAPPPDDAMKDEGDNDDDVLYLRVADPPAEAPLDDDAPKMEVDSPPAPSDVGDVDEPFDSEKISMIEKTWIDQSLANMITPVEGDSLLVNIPKELMNTISKCIELKMALNALWSASPYQTADDAYKFYSLSNNKAIDYWEEHREAVRNGARDLRATIRAIHPDKDAKSTAYVESALARLFDERLISRAFSGSDWQKENFENNGIIARAASNGEFNLTSSHWKTVEEIINLKLVDMASGDLPNDPVQRLNDSILEDAASKLLQSNRELGRFYADFSDTLRVWEANSAYFVESTRVAAPPDAPPPAVAAAPLTTPKSTDPQPIRRTDTLPGVADTTANYELAGRNQAFKRTATATVTQSDDSRSDDSRPLFKRAARGVIVPTAEPEKRGAVRKRKDDDESGREDDYESGMSDGTIDDSDGEGLYAVWPEQKRFRVDIPAGVGGKKTRKKNKKHKKTRNKKNKNKRIQTKRRRYRKKKHTRK